MVLNINIDHRWRYYAGTNTDNEYIVSSVNTDTLDESEWFPMELPHLADFDRDKWWYCKHFHLTLSDQSSKSPVFLTFKSSDADNPITSSLRVVVWLDGIKIFSGLIATSQTSMESSQIMLNSDQAGDSNQKHTLLVCCLNNCLSLNAFLTLPHNDVMPVTGIEEILERMISEGKIKEKKHLNVAKQAPVPLLSIVIFAVGTRGDVQPFIAYGKALRAFGHRVRFAAHEKFRQFVRDNGLEFFPLDGDPTEIMSFMVQNAGMIPSISTIFNGDLLQKRRIFITIMNSTWLACTSDDDETGTPFRAEAIIANPISFGHIHCAQKLGIPLHMVFTMPSSPTAFFPHPLSGIDCSKMSRERLNIFSYSLVDTVMFWGIGDLINEFRRTILNLPELEVRPASSLMVDEKVPHTYCWSPSLVPKPSDWSHYMDVVGYFFLNLGANYHTSSNELLRFLGLSAESNNDAKNISPPIFIGFGSISGHDSQRLLKVVLDALAQTEYRALLSGFDIDADTLPETVLTIGDVPYDWLFQHVSAVCHHGGAGTTADGLRAGKPTIIVPFFGDQFFWGNVVEKSGAGPSPLPGKNITVEQLVEAFKFVHQPAVQLAAKRIQEALLHEDGCTAAVQFFHDNLSLSRMRSDLELTYAACFRMDKLNLKVSRPVAQVLLTAGLANVSEFQYHSTHDWLISWDYASESRMVHHLNINDFQLNSTAARPHTCYGLKNSANDMINESSDDCHCYTKGTSLENNGGMEQTVGNMFYRPSKSFLTTVDDTQDEYSNDLSVLINHAANVSGFSPEVCKHILVEFTRIKRRRMQIPTDSLVKHHRSPFSTIQRSQSFFDLLILPPILLNAIGGFCTILLDVFLYGKILHI